MKVEIGMVSGKIIIAEVTRYTSLEDLFSFIKSVPFLEDRESKRIINVANIEYIEEQSK